MLAHYTLQRRTCWLIIPYKCAHVGSLYLTKAHMLAHYTLQRRTCWLIVPYKGAHVGSLYLTKAHSLAHYTLQRRTSWLIIPYKGAQLGSLYLTKAHILAHYSLQRRTSWLIIAYKGAHVGSLYLTKAHSLAHYTLQRRTSWLIIAYKGAHLGSLYLTKAHLLAWQRKTKSAKRVPMAAAAVCVCGSLHAERRASRPLSGPVCVWDMRTLGDRGTCTPWGTRGRHAAAAGSRPTAPATAPVSALASGPAACQCRAISRGALATADMGSLVS
jgi:hypothetical protein